MFNAADSTAVKKPKHVSASFALELASEKALVAATEANSRIHEGQISLTHGFIPHHAIPSALPPAFAVWDELSANLATYLRTGTERERMAAMPVLTAEDVDALPDQYLARVAAILGNAAHAYYFNQRKGRTQAEDPLPASIREPWEQVYSRLGRSLSAYEEGGLKAARNHYDAFLNNWQLTTPIVLDGVNNVDVTLDDLALLTPMFGSPTESAFTLGMLLTEIRFGAALRPIIQVLQAVAQGNDRQLIAALGQLTHVIEKVTEAIDYLTPNEHSRYYIDQTVWTKTIAKADGAIPGELPSLSGNLLPLFHTLDSLIERLDYQSDLGVSLTEKFKAQPPAIMAFIDGIRADLKRYSLRAYVEASNNPILKSQYTNFVQAYVGPYGFLSVHAVKAYGYMKINFKNGRLATNGNHVGTVHSNPEEAIYQDFKAADAERLQPYKAYPQYANKLAVTSLSEHAVEVTLDVGAIHFDAGDRVAVLPQNSRQDIAFILEKYRLEPNQAISLNSAWQTHLRKEYALEADAMVLAEWLQYVDLRQWINAAAAVAFAVEQCQPLAARLYSVSPLPDTSKIRLTVGLHGYQDQQGARHDGVASHYLTHHTDPLRVTKAPTRSFHLPTDSRKPVLMFAAGTGISPFMGFIDARKQTALAGPSWLFYSAKDHGSFYHSRELAQAMHDGQLNVSVIFSREKQNAATYDHDSQQFHYSEKYPKNHIDQLIQENAAAIADLILEQEASIYVCGNAGFAETVRAALDVALSAKIPIPLDRANYIDTLIADHRYNSDIFTAPSLNATDKTRAIPRSEVALHSSMQNCWVIYNAYVYDVTRFVHEHPGGRKIIFVNAGSNGSADYNGIGHHLNPQIEAMLAQYRVGMLAVPTLSSESQPLYAAVVHYLDLLLEIGSTLDNNTRVPDDSTYVWRETYSVFIEGSLASYATAPTADAMGSFKYIFGSQLNALYDTLQLPKTALTLIYDELVVKASDCAAYIRLAAANPLSEENRGALKHVYQSIIQATFTFIEHTKATIIAVLKDIESHPQGQNLATLQQCLQKVEAGMQAYLAIMKHIHMALKIPRDVQEKIAFANRAAANGNINTCPLGFGKKAVEITRSTSPVSSAETSFKETTISTCSKATEDSFFTRNLGLNTGVVCGAAMLLLNGITPTNLLDAGVTGFLVSTAVDELRQRLQSDKSTYQIN